MIIGLFGVGVVGGGVVQLIQRYHSQWKIVKAYVKDKSKNRGTILENIQLVSQVEDILCDPKIDCVVELIGGIDIAWTIIRTAIMNSKHVVTANKAVVSKHMCQIEALLKDHPEVQFYYDAAVCGGIPVISTIKRLTYSDKVLEVFGIFNGTCNFILSKMGVEKMSFNKAIVEAQSSGFAEANPSADILGWDTRSKLCIVTKLAFDLTLHETDIYCQGIVNINCDDFMYAKMLGCTIKLLAFSQKHPTKDEVIACVWPTMISLNNHLAHINGEYNALVLKTENLGSLIHVGAGAGRFPTANSVVADINEIHCQQSIFQGSLTNNSTFGQSHWQPLSLASDYQAEFYLRMDVVDKVGIIQEVSSVLADHNIMINSILQIPIVDERNVPFAIITGKCAFSAITAVCENLNSRKEKDLNFLLNNIVCLRYMSS